MGARFGAIMGQLIDLTGQRFGSLTVVKRSETAASGHGHDATWVCACDCGETVEKTSSSLRYGKHPSCGCYQSFLTSKRCLDNLAGKRFGRLVVISRETPVGIKHTKWLCKCDCGNTTVVEASSLKSGDTRSCGCIHSEQLATRNRKHGESGTRLHNIWRGMKTRCYNEKSTSYPHYGAKGVKVCKEWRDDFSSFRSWSMDNGYDPNAPRNMCTLDRIDPYGDYEPSNCRWVSMSVQVKNRRPNHS